MAKDKTSVQFYYEYIEQLEDLNDNQFRQIVNAMVLYDRDNKILQLGSVEKVAFNFIKKRIEYDKEKYLEICERNKLNGSKGGRPKTQQNPNKPSGFLENPKEPKKADIDIDIDIDLDIDKDIDSSSSNNNNGKVFEHYQQNIGLLSSHLAEQLETISNEYGEFKVIQAINRACEKNKRNMSYIKGILNQWGDKTWDEILEEDNKFKNKNKKQDYERPSWLDEDFSKKEESEFVITDELKKEFGIE